MNRPKITIHNALTGEIIERQMNDAEFAQWEIDQAAYIAKKQAQEEAATKRAFALGKLEALGLTTDDLKALGL